MRRRHKPMERAVLWKDGAMNKSNARQSEAYHAQPECIHARVAQKTITRSHAEHDVKHIVEAAPVMEVEAIK